MERESEDAFSRRLHSLWHAAWPPGVPRLPGYPLGEMPLSEYLREWARRQPEKVAINFYGAETSYEELDRLSDRFAALLASCGIDRGDPVSVMLSNCPQFNIVFFGILKRGAIYTPVSPMSTAFELRHHLTDSGAKAIVAYDGLWETVCEACVDSQLAHIFTTSYVEALIAEPTIPVPPMVAAPKRLLGGGTDLMAALTRCVTPTPVVEVGMDDIAALNYTGGTTGMPKGCMHTQGDMVYTAAANYQIGAGFDDQTVILNFFPEFWIAGENHGLVFPVFAGATLVLLSRWDAQAFIVAVDRYRVTNLAMPMDAVVEVLEHPEVSHFDLRSIKEARAVSFVKKLDAPYRKAWRDLTESTLIANPYGMTETHTANTFTRGMQQDDFDLKVLPIFVGLPVPGVDLKICDFETQERQELGIEGEIWIKTPALMKGYWRSAGSNEAMLPGGWFRTGDIGVLDTQGYLHYLGRRKEMIKVNGMSVFPSELESVLLGHPSIVGCGVVAMPDEVRGQRPVAFVVLEEAAESPTTQALEAWCRGVLASYKVPKIHILDALPLTGTGKVHKATLTRYVHDALHSSTPSKSAE